MIPFFWARSFFMSLVCVVKKQQMKNLLEVFIGGWHGSIYWRSLIVIIVILILIVIALHRTTQEEYFNNRMPMSQRACVPESAPALHILLLSTCLPSVYLTFVFLSSESIVSLSTVCVLYMVQHRREGVEVVPLLPAPCD